MAIIREDGKPPRYYGSGRSVYNAGYNRTISKAKRNVVAKRRPGWSLNPARLAGRALDFVGGKGLSKVFAKDLDLLRGKSSWGDVKRAHGKFEAKHPKTRVQQIFDSIGNAEKKVLNRLGFGGPSAPKRLRITGGAPSGSSKSSGQTAITQQPPPASSSQSKMRGKRRFNVTSSSVGRFKRAKRRKIGGALQRGCVLKGEVAGSVGDPNAVYVGHNSHPLIPTFRAVCMSIVRLLGKMWKQDFPDFQSAVNGDMPTSDSSVQLTIIYKAAADGLPITTGVAIPNSTWGNLSDQLAHRICSLVTSTTLYFELISIRFSNSSGTTSLPLQTVVFDCKQLKVTVTGKSYMKVQNVTVGSGGETEADAQADDVANNPLSGKIYAGYGQTHNFRFTRDQVGVSAVWKYSSDNGIFTYQAGNTDMSSEMQDVIKKPPPHKAFTHTSGASSILLAPGAIKTSTVKKTYSMSLNSWILKLMNPLRSSASLSAITDGTLCNLGSNAFLGLEHVLNIGSEPNATLGYQVDYHVSGTAKYFKRAYCNPVYDVPIGTVIV